jgi:hypothetical protein
MAHPVALDRFDLDDVRTQVAENLSREWPLSKLREVSDPQTFQRSWHLNNSLSVHCEIVLFAAESLCHPERSEGSLPRLLPRPSSPWRLLRQEILRYAQDDGVLSCCAGAGMLAWDDDAFVVDNFKRIWAKAP